MRWSEFLELHPSNCIQWLHELCWQHLYVKCARYLYASPCSVFLGSKTFNSIVDSCVWFLYVNFLRIIPCLGLHLRSLYLMCVYAFRDVPFTALALRSSNFSGLHNLLMVSSRHADEVLMWAYRLHQF